MSAEAFLATLADSGLPPLIGGRHDGSFRAGVVTRDLGPLRLVELTTPAGECFRTPRAVRATDEGLWQIDVMMRGRVRVQHRADDVTLGPADLVLIDPARPVRYASTASRHVTMLVPRSALRVDGDLAGVRVPGDRGPGALISSLTRDMTDAFTGFRPDQEARTAAAVIELLAVALGSSRQAPASSDASLRDRVTGYIEARLADRDLTPGKVAAVHHLSLRRLHRLFEEEPLTVAALIRRRRLERCHADLAGGRRTVAAVAARWGFADAAHFSRLFKATYGRPPAALMSNLRARVVNDSGDRPGHDGSHGSDDRDDERHPGPDGRGVEPR